MSASEPASASVPAPAPITNINYLFPGSFSPVTVSHIGAVEQLLAGKGLTPDEQKIVPRPKITVYIIPASRRYNKESVKAGTEVYLSEETRKEFLETAVTPLVEKRLSVIVSDAEFEYGEGRIKGVEPGNSPPTSFLVENYKNEIRTDGKTYLEHPENFVNARTYLILGADNAYVDMVGWADPKAILDNMKILVIARGEPPKKPVKRYYKGSTLQPIPNTDTVAYEDVLAERNKIYSDITGDSNYSLQDQMTKNITRLDFTVAEASSSLIRSLIGLGSSKPDVNSLRTVLDQLRLNDSSVPELEHFLENGDVKKDDVSMAKLVGLLTPIPIETLQTKYEVDKAEGNKLKAQDDAAAAAAARPGDASNPGGGARSKKTKRRKGAKGGRRSKTRKRRLTNKRRGNRRRNRTHH